MVSFFYVWIYFIRSCTNSSTLDRVFVKAITTIRALSSRSNYGVLPRPPAESRIKLYGLYKQATEGNVDGIMPRPVGFSIEDEGAKKKWDAWKREEGLSKTEAKRRYISYLIETMRIYASGTSEARELLDELEFLWDQIKDLQFTPDEETNPHLPSYSPLFSQAYSDKNSFVTASNTQYRNNLQKIYSHSRRSTMLSVNDYISQQRSVGAVGTGPKSTYSLPAGRVKIPPQELLESTGNATSNVQEFKNWQTEVNFIIGKLTNELLYKNKDTNNQNENNEQQFSNSNAILIKRLSHVARIAAKNLALILKQLSFQLLALALILWLFKKNILIKRTLVKHEATVKSQHKTYMINFMLNVDESNWIIRLASILNRYIRII